MRAHLLGGVPKAEVTAQGGLFAAHGLDPRTLFVERDANYFDFAPSWTSRQPQAGHRDERRLVAKEAALRDAFEHWWQEHSARITALAGQTDNAASFVGLRNDLLASFSAALEASRRARPLPGARHRRRLLVRRPSTTFMTLMARGAKGVVEPGAPASSPRLKTKPARQRPAGAQAGQVPDGRVRRGHGTSWRRKKAELDSQIKAASAKDAEGDDGEEAKQPRTTTTKATPWTKRSSRRGRRSSPRSRSSSRPRSDSFDSALDTAVDALTPEPAAELLLTILHNDMPPSSSATSPPSASKSSLRSRTGGTSTG